MKQVYAPANAAEAHMLAHLLEQNGIHAHIHGEGLQAAVGELPAANLLQLLVADEDYERGRTLVLEWERASPPVTHEGPVRRRRGLWLTIAAFFIGIFVGWGLKEAALRNALPIDIAEVHSDVNGDGRDDQTFFYRLGANGAYKGVFDRNFDDAIDATEYYSSEGAYVRREADDNFDGFVESRTTYRDGNAARTDIDRNRNGVADMRVYYRRGVVDREEIEGASGRLARINYYEDFQLARSESDLDGDGFLETVRTYDDVGETVSTEMRRPN